VTAEAASLLDLSVLLVLAVAALLGAASGALRQLVSLLAAVAGVLASRAFSRDVGEGLARTLAPVARPLAPVLLFFGVFALASLVGGVILRATGVARVVRGPTDRAAGALLGGAKGALAAWVVVSALVLAQGHLPARAQAWSAGSDLAGVARSHNLVARLDPDAARRLERLPSLPGAAPPVDRRKLEEAQRRHLEQLDAVERSDPETRPRRSR
jgi:membrane protein required for colicin V production